MNAGRLSWKSFKGLSKNIQYYDPLPDHWDTSPNRPRRVRPPRAPDYGLSTHLPAPTNRIVGPLTQLPLEIACVAAPNKFLADYSKTRRLFVLTNT
jgi:hypothetical protein